jgi:hypothetical protein
MIPDQIDCAHSNVILNKRFLRSEGSGRAARRVAFFATINRASGSLPYPMHHYLGRQKMPGIRTGEAAW